MARPKKEKVTKQLTLIDIENKAKQFEEQKKVTLSDGTHVFIYPLFANTKIKDLIKEMITDKERAEKVGIEFNQINDGDWYLFNVIYKFADLGIPSDIEKKVQAFTYLVDTEYFEEIIKAFPKQSLKKLEESLLRFKENFDLILKEQGFVSDEKVEGLLNGENNIVQQSELK